MIEPLLRCVVGPGVNEFDIFTTNVVLGELLWRIFVQEVILLLISDLVETVFKVTLENVNANCPSLFLLEIVLLLLMCAIHS
jgi:hypothetical protein